MSDPMFLEEVSALLADEYRDVHSQDVKVVECIQNQDVAGYKAAQEQLESMREDLDAGFAVTLKLLNVPEKLIPNYVGELHSLSASTMWFWEPEQPNVLVNAIAAKLVDCQADALDRLRRGQISPEDWGDAI